MNPLCIVQARMGSTRLPGKVMMEIKGKPLMGYLLERLAGWDDNGHLIVAVPTKDAGQLKNIIFRHALMGAWDGPDEDVAGRFAAVFRETSASTFIRICADSPLLDPALVDAAVAVYEPPYFMIHSPVGCIEVCDTRAFLADLPGMNGEEREHVTLTLKAKAIHSPLYIGGGYQRLIVDTQEDFDRARLVIEKMDRPHAEYGWRECLALL